MPGTQDDYRRRARRRTVRSRLRSCRTVDAVVYFVATSGASARIITGSPAAWTA
jgi:hypothetical protein